MKRLFALLLIFALLVPFTACGETPAETVAETAETAAPAKTAEKPVETKAAETKPVTVENPLTRAQIDAIPVASNEMSSDQLRQICLDFLALQVSFPWTPSRDYNYHVERQDYDVAYKKGQLFAGIPYVNVASGSVYRYAELMNPQTGEFDPLQFDLDNILWGTACSGTACWSLQRVVNSAKCSWTAELNVANGFLRVGPYTYDDDTVRYGEDGKLDCKPIAQKNGAQTMYESYALLNPADVLVNNGHVRLCGVKPTVVRNEDGTIDGARSMTSYYEQGMYRNLPYQMRTQSDGTVYSIQGGVDVPITFEELFNNGYLPHTCKEFLGLDPVEKSAVDLGISGDTVSLAALSLSTLTSNYTISDVFFVATDADGKMVTRSIYRSRNHFTRSFAMNKIFQDGPFLQYADGNHILEISVQLSTGEKPVIFRGTFTK